MGLTHVVTAAKYCTALLDAVMWGLGEFLSATYVYACTRFNLGSPLCLNSCYKSEGTCVCFFAWFGAYPPAGWQPLPLKEALIAMQMRRAYFDIVM